jgi:hypothetical protein
MAADATKLFETAGRDRVQQLVDSGRMAPDYMDAAQAWLNPKGEAEVGPAKMRDARVEGFGSAQIPVVKDNAAAVNASGPPRSDLPLKEGATYKAGPAPQTAMPSPDGSLNTNDLPKYDNVPPVGDFNTKDGGIGATQTALQPAQTLPQDPNAAGGALAGIDVNGQERKSTTTSGTSRVIESDQHKQDMQSFAEAKQAEAQAYRAVGEVKKAQGDAQAAETQGYAQRLQEGNAQYQQKVEARKAQTDAAMQARDRASQDYQDTVKNVPLGTMLNPTTAQAVGSAIAQALGAFGSTLAHGQNAALAILNTQLDAAQKERSNQLQGKAFSVRMADRHLQDLRNIYQDEDAAHLAWKADQKEMAATKALQLAQQYGGDEAKANGEAFAQAAMASAAHDRAAADARYDKQVQSSTTTSTESGPMVALRAAEAKAKLAASMKGGQNITVPYEKYDAWKNKRMAADEIMKSGVQNIPSAIQRINARYGSDVAGWGKAAAAGFADADLTPAQKDSVAGMYRLMNAEILDQTGKAMTENEAGRIKLGLGFADFGSPNDVMRAVQRIGGKLNVDRASIIASNPAYGDTFRAFDAVQGAQAPGPSGKSYGTVPGQ